MKFIKAYVSKANAQRLQADIESNINNIVKVAGELPYKSRMEAIQRILNGMDEREKECYNEIEEINKAKELL